MSDKERQREEDAYGGIGTFFFCIGTIAAALYAMKKISESNRPDEKLSWLDFMKGERE